MRQPVNICPITGSVFIVIALNFSFFIIYNILIALLKENSDGFDDYECFI